MHICNCKDLDVMTQGACSMLCVLKMASPHKRTIRGRKPSYYSLFNAGFSISQSQCKLSLWPHNTSLPRGASVGRSQLHCACLSFGMSCERPRERRESAVGLMSICLLYFLKGLGYPGSRGADNMLGATPLAQWCFCSKA